MKEQILQKAIPALAYIKRYLVLGACVLLLGMYTFLVFKVNASIQAEPSEDAVIEKLKTVQRPRVDQNTLTKIQDLQDQSVQVQSLFDDARSNPFVD